MFPSLHLQRNEYSPKCTREFGGRNFLCRAECSPDGGLQGGLTVMESGIRHILNIALKQLRAHRP